MKKGILFGFLLLIIFSLLGCQKEVEQIYASSSGEEMPEVSEKTLEDTIEFSDLELQIWQYWCDVYDLSVKGKSTIVGEEIAYVKTSNEYGLSILEVERIRYKVNKYKYNLKNDLEDASIDFLMMKRIEEDFNFVNKDEKWYYNNEEINIGEPLPVPEHLLSKDAELGKEINVYIDLTADISELKELTVVGKTNLPDGMSLMLEVTDSNERYFAIEDVIVNNGEFRSKGIIDVEQPAKRMKNGIYTVKIKSATASVLSDKVRAVIGENGENLIGDLVAYDSLFGNMIDFTGIVEIK